MRSVRLLAALAAMIAVLASSGVAHAATITRPFAADSGDACRYGATGGTLGWRYGTRAPLVVIGVDVHGQLTDRPVPNDPSIGCFDDHYYSAATFTAYAGSVEVARKTSNANNKVTFEFTLDGTSTTPAINRVVIQVCRSPISTQPPSYCGKARRVPGTVDSMKGRHDETV
jgi:hypothetical protein